MAPRVQTVGCGRGEARQRLAVAETFLDAARMVLEEPDRDGYLGVASGNAILAGVAAGDTICCIRLGRMHRGPDHRRAVDLLSEALPDGKTVSQDLQRLLSLNEEIHYGVIMTSARKAEDSVKRAAKLIARARTEVDR